jgi:manganese/zinc/iron transport system substrate-binding protein
LINQKEIFVLLKTIIIVAWMASIAHGQLNIVATTGMVADITRQVVGDRGNVVALMGEGVDPHLYKPTSADALKIMNADLIFYNGLLLEGRMTDTFLKAARMGKVVYPVTELIEETYLLEPPEFEGHFDPHVWMDVSAWAQAVDAVAVALCQQDPVNSEVFRTNAKDYNKKLTKLHSYAVTSIAAIPKDQRVLITAHDAFNYFGRAYGIEVVGIQGLSTESEAGIEDVNRLVNMIVDKGITAVFVESSVSDRNIKALIEGAKSKGHSVKIGGRLFSDAMGKTGTYEGTYIGMLDHNITTIANALGRTKNDGFKSFLTN